MLLAPPGDYGVPGGQVNGGIPNGGVGGAAVWVLCPITPEWYGLRRNLLSALLSIFKFAKNEARKLTDLTIYFKNCRRVGLQVYNRENKSNVRSKTAPDGRYTRAARPAVFHFKFY